MTGRALRLCGVSAGYGAEKVLRGLSFEADYGEKVALFGLNGSGKTTALMACVGLARFEGEIEVCGERVEKKTLDKIRRNVGFLFNQPEDQLLFPLAEEDAAFNLIAAGVEPSEAKAKARSALESVGALKLARRDVFELSRGERLKVALAGAIASDPPLLLLDEPNAGMDPPGRKRLAEYLSQCRSAIVCASHDAAFARSFCSRFVLIDDGVAALSGTDFSAVEEYWEKTAAR